MKQFPRVLSHTLYHPAQPDHTFPLPRIWWKLRVQLKKLRGTQRDSLTYIS
jgi:hypothetical protein